MYVPFCFISTVDTNIKIQCIKHSRIAYVRRAPEWIAVEVEASAPSASAYRVELSAEWPAQWWPFSGWLALRFRVLQARSSSSGSSGGRTRSDASNETETVVGVVRVAVESLEADTQQFVRSELEFPVRLLIVPTPPRECVHSLFTRSDIYLLVYCIYNVVLKVIRIIELLELS